MKLGAISMAMLLPTMVTLAACQSSVPLEQYDQDLNEADQRVEKLEAEVSDLRQEIADLKKDIDRLRDSVPGLAAKDILGQWNSVVPSSARLRFGAVTVKDIFYADPNPGPSDQLNKAFMRMALITAIDLVGFDVRFAEPDEQYRILNQCLEYILGINSVTLACGLE